MTECWDGARAVISVISRKWVLDVLRVLTVGPHRHNELQRAIGKGVHANTFDHTLRRMEGVGFIARRVVPGVPPGTAYELTALGRSLLEPIAEFGRWVADHRDELESQRGWPER